MKRIHTIILAGFLITVTAACAHEGHEQGVSFRAPEDGATVSRIFNVKMAVKGMEVHKAGDIVKGTGHFHLIIDNSCVRKGENVTHDATHKHYGKGQTEATLELASGEHTLALQFANGHHESYGKDWCRMIHITVE